MGLIVVAVTGSMVVVALPNIVVVVSIVVS